MVALLANQGVRGPPMSRPCAKAQASGAVSLQSAVLTFPGFNKCGISSGSSCACFVRRVCFPRLFKTLQAWPGYEHQVRHA